MGDFAEEAGGEPAFEGALGHTIAFGHQEAGAGLEALGPAPLESAEGRFAAQELQRKTDLRQKPVPLLDLHRDSNMGLRCSFVVSLTLS